MGGGGKEEKKGRGKGRGICGIIFDMPHSPTMESKNSAFGGCKWSERMNRKIIRISAVRGLILPRFGNTQPRPSEKVRHPLNRSFLLSNN